MLNFFMAYRMPFRSHLTADTVPNCPCSRNTQKMRGLFCTAWRGGHSTFGKSPQTSLTDPISHTYSNSESLFSDSWESTRRFRCPLRCKASAAGSTSLEATVLAPHPISRRWQGRSIKVRYSAIHDHFFDQFEASLVGSAAGSTESTLVPQRSSAAPLHGRATSDKENESGVDVGCRLSNRLRRIAQQHRKRAIEPLTP